MVPTEAVIVTGKRTVVFVAEGEGKFRAVDVEIGIEANGMTEIRKGLEPGQKVVVSGQFLIDSEASLKGVTESPVRARAGTAAGRRHGEHRGAGSRRSDRARTRSCCRTSPCRRSSGRR